MKLRPFPLENPSSAFKMQLEIEQSLKVGAKAAAEWEDRKINNNNDKEKGNPSSDLAAPFERFAVYRFIIKLCAKCAALAMLTPSGIPPSTRSCPSPTAAASPPGQWLLTHQTLMWMGDGRWSMANQCHTTIYTHMPRPLTQEQQQQVRYKKLHIYMCIHM